MATNKKFSSLTVQRFDVDFSATSITSGAAITIGVLPANIIITDGWMVVKSDLTDSVNNATATMSIGYTSAAAGLYPATVITAMNAGAYLKLIPGVINVGSGQALTTVDTPAEVVGIARVSADTHSGIALTATKNVILTGAGGANINGGTVSIFIEYLKFA